MVSPIILFIALFITLCLLVVVRLIAYHRGYRKGYLAGRKSALADQQRMDFLRADMRNRQQNEH